MSPWYCATGRPGTEYSRHPFRTSCALWFRTSLPPMERTFPSGNIAGTERGDPCAGQGRTRTARVAHMRTIAQFSTSNLLRVRNAGLPYFSVTNCGRQRARFIRSSAPLVFVNNTHVLLVGGNDVLNHSAQLVYNGQDDLLGITRQVGHLHAPERVPFFRRI
jgi:hypothetical protein